MKRRDFLKTIAVGAVGAVVPLSAPVELVTITGTVTAHFENTALYEKVLSGNQVFVRWCQETVFCEHPKSFRTGPWPYGSRQELVDRGILRNWQEKE